MGVACHRVTTEDHPYWNVTDEAGEGAEELDAGDLPRTPTGVASVDSFDKSAHRLAPAYTLSVADLHTYYVMAGSVPVLVHNCGEGFWSSIKATQPLIPGTGGLPKSFELTAGNTRVWVHGNASKHVAEYAQSMILRGASPEAVGLGTQSNLRSLQAAVEEAGKGGLTYDRLVVVATGS